jgi:hypothetical protein
MVEYPMYIARDYINEVDIKMVKTVNTNLFDESKFAKIVSLDEKTVNDARMRLQQIEKTTVTAKNTIESFIRSEDKNPFKKN